jgi:subtilisin family serine protease
MLRSTTRRRAVLAGLPAVALGLAVSLTATPASATSAPSADSALALNMNYTVNSATGSGAMADVKAAIKKAGGEVLSQYAEIGVTVAQSDSGSFAKDLRKQDKLIDSVGATRTSEVGAPLAPKTDDVEVLQDQKVDPEPREDEQWGNEVLQVLKAHAIEDGKASVLVGDLDSGVEDRHEDLKANFNRDASVDCTESGVPNTDEGAWRPTSSTHGTHTAGTIVAARNGKGIAGVAPGVELASIKVVDDSGFIFPEYAICGFMWALDHDVDVTNNSYYVDPWWFWCKNDPDQGAVLESMTRAITYTQKKGMVNVAAAGNQAYDLAHKTTDTSSPDDSTPVTREVNKNCLSVPAEIEGVITVSAIQSDLHKAGFSNYGKGKIDVAAPGVNVLSTLWNGSSYDQYGYLSGTSMASPHVAGIVALIESVKPGMSLEKITKIVYKTSVDTGCGGASGCEGDASNNGFFGRGIVNALNVVK